MRVSRTNLGFGTAAVGVAALLISTLLPAAQASSGSGGSSGAPPGYVRIPNSAYTPTAGEQDLGSADPSAPVRFTLSMKVRNQGAADALARAVSDPTSRSYGAYLSPAQYRARFAPTAGAAATVTRWLRGAGMTIAYDPANHLTITATGDVAEADRAFFTDLHLYRTAPDPDGNTSTFLAPKTSLYVPRGVNSVVSGFLEGINKAARLARPMNRRSDTAPDVPGTQRTAARTVHTSAAVTAPARTAAPPPPAFVNSGPCSTFWAQRTDGSAPAVPASYATPLPYAPCGYTPSAAPGRLRHLEPAAVGRQRPRRHRRDHRRVQRTDDPQRREHLRRQARPAGVHAAASSRQITARLHTATATTTPSTATSAASRAGTARRPWTSRPCTRWRLVRTCCTSAARAAWTATCCSALNTIIDGHRADIISNSWGDLGEDGRPRHPQHLPHGVRAGRDRGHRRLLLLRRQRRRGRQHRLPDASTSRRPTRWVTAVGGTSLAVGARQTLPVRDRAGAPSKSTPHRRRVGPGASRQLPLRRRRRHQPAVRPALVPARRRARARSREYFGGSPGPGRPGHRRCRRPEHRVPGRRDPDVPGRQRQVRRVPHRRHQPRQPADGRHRGARRPGRRSRARVREPGDLPAVRQRRVPRRRRPGQHARRSCVSTTSTASTPTDGRTTSLRTIEPDAEPAHPARATTT